MFAVRVVWTQKAEAAQARLKGRGRGRRRTQAAIINRTRSYTVDENGSRSKAAIYTQYG